MARTTLEDALRELEFLFKPERYPSYRESWEVVREYALEGQRFRRSQGSPKSSIEVDGDVVPK